MARLFLTPTDMERKLLTKHLLASESPLPPIELCGFGPVAASAMTSHWIQNCQPSEIVLLGIAGTYDPKQLPVGVASFFSETVLDGVGIGEGVHFESASSLGWNMFPDHSFLATNDILTLDILQNDILPSVELPVDPTGSDVQAMPKRLATVCGASSSLEMASLRSQRLQSHAEDMEGFAVAASACLAGIPCYVARGISNIAGDRNHTEWKIDEAIKSLVQLIQSTWSFET